MQVWCTPCVELWAMSVAFLRPTPCCTQKKHDAGYLGGEKRPEASGDVTWHIAKRLGRRRAIEISQDADGLLELAEMLKVWLQAKVGSSSASSST